MKDSSLCIIPLGGVGEIGLNMTLFQHDGSIMVVDAGLMFPEEEMLGVDVVIPDMSYLYENRDMVKGVIITHGHEDHIGALPYLLKEVDVPVYATPLTLGLISEKLREHNMDTSTLVPVNPRDVVDIGPFRVECIRVTHSIVDGIGLAIDTPLGPVIHTGDFKIDQTPVDGELMDLHRFSEYGRMNALALLSDSTNVEKEGYSLSEREVGLAFDEIFMNAKGRIIVATFASNIHRIQQVIDVAQRHNRKVVLNGRSMVNNARIALELGYLNFPQEVAGTMEDIYGLPDDRLVIVTTGSQGEPMSSLSRMAMGDHKHLKIKDGDTVILSARFIPGKEKAIGRIINHLFRRGANVFYEQVSDIHVSGHACREEQKMMINLIRPKYFIPIHGEYRHLVYHARLAEELGIPRKNIFILEDGDILKLTRDGAMREGKVKAGRVFVDGKGIGDVSDIVLRDRQHLGMDGVIIVLAGIEKSTWKIIIGPEIISRGFVYEEVSQEIIEEIKSVVLSVIDEIGMDMKEDWIVVKEKVSSAVKKFIKKRIERRPMIIPIIIEL